MAADCFVGDIGFQIFIASTVDLSGAAGLKIRYRKPDNTDGEWVAVAGTKNGNFGCYYLTQSIADLDQAGTWKLDIEIDGVNTFIGSSSSTSMLVGRPLPGA